MPGIAAATGSYNRYNIACTASGMMGVAGSIMEKKIIQQA
jgi:hypothetical protein